MIGMTGIRYGMKYGDFHAGSGRRCPRRPAREATWKAPARCDVVRCCQFEVRQHVRDRGEQPFPSGALEGVFGGPRSCTRTWVRAGEFRGVRTMSASLDGVDRAVENWAQSTLAQAELQIEYKQHITRGSRAADLATRAS